MGQDDPRQVVDCYLASHMRYSDADIARIIKAVTEPPKTPVVLPAEPIKVELSELTGVKPPPSVQLNRRTALRFWLERAAEKFQFSKVLEGLDVAPSALAEEYKKIVSEADKLFSRIDSPRPTKFSKTKREQAENTSTSSEDASEAERIEAEEVEGKVYAYREAVQTSLGVQAGSRYALSKALAGVLNIRNWANEAASTADSHKRPRTERRRGDEALNDLCVDLCLIFEQVFHWPTGRSTDPEGIPEGPLGRFIKAALVPLDFDLSEDAISSRVQRLPPSVRLGNKKT